MSRTAGERHRMRRHRLALGLQFGDKGKSLKAALADVRQELEALKRTKAEIADRKLRAQTAAELELLARNMTEVAADYDAAGAGLAELTARAVPFLWEARGLDDFIVVGRAQVPPAIDKVSQLLRSLRAIS